MTVPISSPKAHMRHSKIRMIRFMELRLGHGEGALHYDSWNLETLLQQASRNGFYARKVKEGAEKVVRIRDLKIQESQGKRYASLLLVHANAGYIDASYENIQTAQSRTIKKNEGEGYRTEAHLVIDLGYTQHGKEQRYRCVLEESPGLGPSIINSRLRSALNKAGTRKGTVPNTGEEITWYPVVYLDGLLNGDLIAEIEKGELLNFELLKENPESGGLDEIEEIEVRHQVLRIDVLDSPKKGMFARLVSKIRSLAFKQDYEKLRIRYKEQNTDRVRSAVIDIPDDMDDPSSAIEKSVTRTAMIKLEEPMNWDHDTVETQLTEKMIKHLQQEP